MGQLVASKPGFSPSAINNLYNQAIRDLADLCDRIDAGEDLDELMIETHALMKEDAKRYSDIAIAFDEALDASIAHAKQMQDYYYGRRKTLEAVKDKLRDGLKKTVENFADQIQVKGSLGSLSLRKKKDTVEYHCLIESKSVSSVVRDDIIKQFGISPAYLEAVTFMKLNRKKVEEDLAKGVELPWAELKKDEKTLAVRKG